MSSNSRKLGDLQPLHAPGMNPSVEAKLRRMTDQEVLETVLHPADGQLIKVRPGENSIIDGNTRVYEMLRRMQANPHGLFNKDLELPVEEVSRKPLGP